MRKIVYRKRIHLNKIKVIFLLLLLIILNTSVFIYYFTDKLSDAVLLVAERELKEISQLTIGNNISREDLPKVSVDEIIIAHRDQNNEITDIDFKLDVAYDMMFALKGKLDLIVADLQAGKLTTKTTVIGDNLVIKVPFYSYTNNILLTNLGPKIYLKIELLELVRGSVTTKVTSYGINTSLVNVYLNLFITESIVFPTNRENIVLEYELLLASKVIQGKVPSLYTGKYEASSDIINID